MLNVIAMGLKATLSNSFGAQGNSLNLATIKPLIGPKHSKKHYFGFTNSLQEFFFSLTNFLPLCIGMVLIYR